MNKVCSKCKIEKPKSEFRTDNRRKDKLASWCKECDREYKKVYYERNKDEINAKRRFRYKTDESYHFKISETNRNWHKENKTQSRIKQKEYISEIQSFIDSLKTPCVKCGENRPWLIQFHHIEPQEKSFQIQATHSKQKLEEESKKCVCLCCNCHAEYHYFFGKQPKQPKESLEYYMSEEFNHESIKVI